jgi:cyclase
VASKRLILQFLLKGRRLVKGTRFKGFTDVGDPVAQAVIYDAQGADEIVIVDVEASRKGAVIDPNVISAMTRQCRLPIAAGGGIRSVRDARTCFHAGADKIVVNTAALLRPKLIRELSEEFGAQSVMVSLDVKRGPGGLPVVLACSGSKAVAGPLEEHLERAVSLGAGEILLTSIDREGTLSGYDDGLYARTAEKVTVPIIASGGAGCYDDLVRLFQGTAVDAAAIGKMLFLRDYDVIRIRSYLRWKGVTVRDA